MTQQVRAGYRWEVAEKDWPAVRDTVLQALVVAAHEKKTVTYAELAAQVPGVRGAGSHAMSAMLKEITMQCLREGTPLLTVLVVNSTTGEPGNGFYDLVRGYGRMLDAPDLQSASLREAELVWTWAESWGI